MLSPEPVHISRAVTVTQLLAAVIGAAGVVAVHLWRRASWAEIRAIFRRPNR